MAEDRLETLATLPGFNHPEPVPEHGELAYWWREGEDVELRLLDVESRDYRTVPVADLGLDGWEGLRWTGERFLVYTRPDTYLLDRDGTAETVLPESDYTRVFGTDEPARRFLYVRYGENDWDLRLHDRADGTTRVLSETTEQGGHAGFSPDGRWLAFLESIGDDFNRARCVVTDRDGDREREFAAGDSVCRTELGGWHPDGDRLLVADRTPGTYRAGVYEWRTGEVTWLGSSKHNEWPAHFTADGERVLATRLREGAVLPVVYDADDPGEGRVLDLPEGVSGFPGGLDTADLLSTSTVLLEHEAPTRPPRLLAYDLDTDETSVLLDTRTDAFEALDAVDAEYVRYPSTDGHEVGAVYYDSGRQPSPAVVMVHGGPSTREERDFDPFAQYLAGEGYSVLQPNYRGSTDQDEAFQDALRDDIGGGEVDDVAAGAEWLVENAGVDPTRIAVYGRSHGAYNAAMAAVRFSERWAVAILKNGYLDLEPVYGDPNPYARRRVLAEGQAEDGAFLRERSPMHRVEDIDCPVWLVYGTEDPGFEQAERLADRFSDSGRTEGTDFALETFEGEGHAIQDKERLWGLVADVLARKL